MTIIKIRIRPIQYKTDIARITDVWYEASILAHSFIDKAYWLNARTLMATVYIPKSKTWVMLSDEKMIGFYSVFENKLAAIFIDPNLQGMGYGAKLIKHAFEQSPRLELNVYQKNQTAVRFYHAHGFKVESECIDDNTGEAEYKMVWERNG